MSKQHIKTLDEVREDFARAGISFKSWAKANSFSYQVVRDVMSNRRQYLWGEAHRVAVALGLKDGEVVPVEEFKPVAVKVSRPARARRSREARAAA